jgi:hypothetical protein
VCSGHDVHYEVCADLGYVPGVALAHSVREGEQVDVAVSPEELGVGEVAVGVVLSRLVCRGLGQGARADLRFVHGL